MFIPGFENDVNEVQIELACNGRHSNAYRPDVKATQAAVKSLL